MAKSKEIIKKTAEQFATKARENNITWWGIHNCGFCGYACGYVIEGDKVFYDSGCDCTYGGELQPRSWDSLAELYNMQSSEKYIKEMNDFWGFEE